MTNDNHRLTVKAKNNQIVPSKAIITKAVFVGRCFLNNHKKIKIQPATTLQTVTKAVLTGALLMVTTSSFSASADSHTGAAQTAQQRQHVEHELTDLTNKPDNLGEYVAQNAKQAKQLVTQKLVGSDNNNKAADTTVSVSSNTNNTDNSDIKDSNNANDHNANDHNADSNVANTAGQFAQDTFAATTGQQAREQTRELQANRQLQGDYNEAYYAVTVLNEGLPKLKEPVSLLTPLATLEFFNTAMLQKKFSLASYALNMNLIDKKLQTAYGSELVKKLDFLLSDKDLYVFDQLPDRADGLIEPPIGSSSSINGIPRRSIKLGYIDYGDRRVPISLERVRVGDSAPVWVFSAQTVENIEMLYDQHKPAEFVKYLPEWLKPKFLGIAFWEYLALLLFFTVTFGMGWLFSKAAEKLVSLYTKDKDSSHTKSSHTKKDSLPDLFNKLLVPLTFTISFSLLFALVSGAFPYIDAIASSTRPIVWMGLVIVSLWFGMRLTNFFANRYKDLQIENLDDENFHAERRRRTYVSIFRRIFIFAMLIGGIWVGLSEFANLEGLGKTLLTSAGIAGAVIGIAAQPVLGNIVAGMLVAVTQPIRIGDTVMMQGEWCTVEDLGYTYASLLTWDERRLMVPMRYFVTEVLENWSHTDAHQSSAVYLYVDYGADIEEIRQKFFELVKNHDLWDGDTEPELLVTSMTEDTVKLRGVVSANNPNDAWSLECAVRESMLEYLANERKAYLPTERITFKG